MKLCECEKLFSEVVEEYFQQHCRKKGNERIVERDCSVEVPAGFVL